MIAFTQFQIIPDTIPTNQRVYRIFGLDGNGIMWATSVHAYQLDSDKNIPAPESNYSGALRWKKVPTP